MLYTNNTKQLKDGNRETEILGKTNENKLKVPDNETN